MYLPLKTTFAIFVGGLIKGAADRVVARQLTGEQKITFENIGILLASGFIAGEALTGVLIAGLVLIGIPSLTEVFFGVEMFSFVDGPIGGWLALGVFAMLIYALVAYPLKKAK